MRNVCSAEELNIFCYLYVDHTFGKEGNGDDILGKEERGEKGKDGSLFKAESEEKRCLRTSHMVSIPRQDVYAERRKTFIRRPLKISRIENLHLK